MTTSLELNRELDTMANELIASDGRSTPSSGASGPSQPVSFPRHFDCADGGTARKRYPVIP